VEDQAIGATPLDGHGRPPAAFARGRVCREAGCGTLLSIYHEGEWCYRHEPPELPRVRGKKIA
jgi:hypothetical protein